MIQIPLQQPRRTRTGKFSQVLFDFDLWCYDIAFAAEGSDGSRRSPSWVVEVIHTRLEEILDTLLTDNYKGYLTGKGNFRFDLAKRHPYKASRPPKPHYYQFIRTYLEQQLNAEVVEGIEADDALAIALTDDPEAVCVSRDKDLRQVPGWHYSYSVGNQPEWGPELVDEIGYLKYKPGKLFGTGLKFFYSQVITGDTVDEYKGLEGKGPAYAYKLLDGCLCEREMYRRVLDSYEEKYAERAFEELLEQARLAWMVRQLHEDGSPVMWEPPEV